MERDRGRKQGEAGRQGGREIEGRSKGERGGSTSILPSTPGHLLLALALGLGWALCSGSVTDFQD